MSGHPAASTVPTLEVLPEEALKHTLSFLGKASDFLSLELTCKTFHHVISTQDLEIWGKLIPGNCKEVPNEPDPANRFQIEDPRFQSFREQACVEETVRYVRCHQKKTSNLLLDGFESKGIAAVARWKQIITRVLEELPGSLRPGPHVRYSLRGDTMGTLMEIMQSALITAFQRALKCCVDWSAEDTYPVLKTFDLKLQDKLAQNFFSECDHERVRCFCLFKPYQGELVHFEEEMVPIGIRETIIRAAAFRAGVTKMDNDVYEMAWNALVNLISLILTPVHHVLVSQIPNTSDLPANQKRTLVAPCETIRDIAPFPLKLPNENGAIQTWLYLLTPVPRMVEEAADKIPSISIKKAYNEWLTDGASMEEEIAAAEAEYDFIAADIEVDGSVSDDSSAWSWSATTDEEDADLEDSSREENDAEHDPSSDDDDFHLSDDSGSDSDEDGHGFLSDASFDY